MAGSNSAVKGPDLTLGIELSSIPDGAMLLGHVGDEQVILIRRGQKLCAVGAKCTHYGAPLVQGLLVGDTLRCPWHHACFDIWSGDVQRAPALDAIPVWRVESAREGALRSGTPEEHPGTFYVRRKLESPARRPHVATTNLPQSVVIVGGGAAGNTAAETLRREGYAGAIMLVSADDSLPCDRPNLSKGYLAGTASDDANLLRSASFYAEHEIEMRLGTRVAAIDTVRKRVTLEDGSHLPYGAVLLATGATPVRLDIPGSDLPHVHYLRTLEDGRTLVESASWSHRAVVIGASFIGLEVAASLRARNVEVDVVAPETVPMGKVLGPVVGSFLHDLHLKHGVRFHLGATAASIEERTVTLNNGKILQADLVVIGIGVRPAISLAEQAGLSVDRGVTVDQYLETSAPGVFAAGDIARWPDRLTGERIRVEHFVVAERQGQTAARNIIGRRERFEAVPFFWTEQYDFSLAYVGHAERWNEVQIDGSLELRDCTVTYRREGKKLATAFVGRDHAGLLAELDFEETMTRGSTATPPLQPGGVAQVKRSKAGADDWRSPKGESS